MASLMQVSTKCKECGKSYSKLSNLKTHISTIHSTDGNLVVCEYCKKQMRETSIRKHKKVCKINPLSEPDEVFNCNVCNVMFPSRKDLDYHTGNSHEKVNKCSKCEVSFKDLKNLKMHVH